MCVAGHSRDGFSRNLEPHGNLALYGSTLSVVTSQVSFLYTWENKS